MGLAATFKNWLFRWQGDGEAPIVLTQRRVFILPTRAGLLFAVVLILMLVGAINYNLALGHALVFLLAGIALAGMVNTFRNLAGLTIAGGRPEPVFAGETAHFPLHLSSQQGGLRLGLEFQAGSGPIVGCDLTPEGRRRIDLPVFTHQRGWLDLPRIRLSSRYPLGLFVAWSYPWPTMRCLVYPAPIYYPLPPLSASSAQGEWRGTAGQEDFAGLRERQPADSLRHIAWKAVARDFDNRPLLTKQFAGGVQTELWLAWEELPAETGIEQRLSILAGWVLAADRAGAVYGLALPGIRLKPAQGPAHRQECLAALALFRQP